MNGIKNRTFTDSAAAELVLSRPGEGLVLSRPGEGLADLKETGPATATVVATLSPGDEDSTGLAATASSRSGQPNWVSPDKANPVNIFKS